MRLDVECDDTLLSGEVGDAASLLPCLAFLVSSVFHGRLAHQRDWGQAPATAVTELVADTAAFAAVSEVK